MLGIREPDQYGKETYSDLEEKLKTTAKKDIEVKLFQSNHEGYIVDEIQNAYGNFDGIVINPGAYTHTSIAILDAVKAVNIRQLRYIFQNWKSVKTSDRLVLYDLPA